MFSGAGAAAIATAEHYVRLGVQAREHHHVRPQWRDLRRAARRDESVQGALRARTRSCARSADAMKGADVFVGLSVGGRGNAGHGQDDGAATRSSSRWPTPIRRSCRRKSRPSRPDAIIATGRTDYPNQVNNVLGFPFIFRGALDVSCDGDQRGDEDGRDARARRPGQAGRARDGRCARTAGRRSSSGRDYLIPKPFDPRVLLWVAPAVAQAAMEIGRGAACRSISTSTAHRLEARLGRRREVMRDIIAACAARPEAHCLPGRRERADHPRGGADSPRRASRSRSCSAARTHHREGRQRCDVGPRSRSDHRASGG